MIASIILALHLLGAIPVGNAVTLLYLAAALLLATEFILGAFGILAFNGAMALLIAVTLHTDTPVMLGVIPMGWGLFFGIAFFELALLVAAAANIIRMKKKRASTGIEGMIGSKASVVEWRDKKGRVFIDGETWLAVSRQKLTLNKDDAVTIESVNRLTLIVNTET